MAVVAGTTVVGSMTEGAEMAGSLRRARAAARVVTSFFCYVSILH